MSVSDIQYLILGGSTKCGTTSLFHYLEFHPGICPCVMKESRYFWSGDYQPGTDRKPDMKAGTFESLFRDCRPGQVRLEATPDYLYSAAAGQRIRNELPGARMLFLLRDPVDRLHSWYRFSLQNGFIPASMDFGAYVEIQKTPSKTATPQHLRSLEQGRYAGYLENYYRLFGKQNIHLAFYEHLVADPGHLCKEAASFSGIDPSYFDTLAFRVYNPSSRAKSVMAHQLFRKLKRAVRPVTRALPAPVRKTLKAAGFHTENMVRKANSVASTGKNIMDPVTKAFLEDYYQNDRERFISLTGIVPPWKKDIGT